jgi:hypothetical protein
MKKVFLTASIALFSLNFYAQKITVPEPEFINTVVLVKDNKTTKLEKAIPYELARRTIASYAVGVGGSKVFKQVKGAKSTVRVPQDVTYTFIVRPSSNEYDPFDEITIIKMSSGVSNRKYEVHSVDVIGQAKSGDVEYIKFEGKKYGKNSYLIQTSQDLQPGEYAINIRHSTDVLNCFAVEGATKAKSGE